jgi:hypothetical protein
VRAVIIELAASCQSQHGNSGDKGDQEAHFITTHADIARTFFKSFGNLCKRGKSPGRTGIFRLPRLDSDAC